MLEILPGFLQENRYQEGNFTYKHWPGPGKQNKTPLALWSRSLCLVFKIEKNAKRRKIEFKMVVILHHFRH